MRVWVGWTDNGSYSSKWTNVEGVYATREAGQRAAGVQPVVALESGNPQVLRQMVAMGLGCSVLPAAIAESGPEAGSLQRGPLLAERPLCLVRRRSSPPDPRAEAFLRLALEATSMVPPADPA